MLAEVDLPEDAEGAALEVVITVVWVTTAVRPSVTDLNVVTTAKDSAIVVLALTVSVVEVSCDDSDTEVSDPKVDDCAVVVESLSDRVWEDEADTCEALEALSEELCCGCELED